MKEIIYISKNLYKNKTGGGHNFLRSLVKLLEKRGNYAQNIHNATTVIINSHQNVFSNLIIRIVYPKKKLILRIDGKASLHRPSLFWDNLTEWQARYLADSIIYQSNWSKEIWKRRFVKIEKKSIVIQNACDGDIFYPSCTNKSLVPILKVISSANSNNLNKGLQEIYKLDEIMKSLTNIRHEIRVFGYGQMELERISENLILHPRIAQERLALEIRESNVFFAPFRNEACSNSIIEALACGVPVLTANSGGNMELIRGNGIVYNSISDLTIGVLTLLNNHQELYTESKLRANFYNRDVSNDYLIFATESLRYKTKFWGVRAPAKLIWILTKRAVETAVENFVKRIQRM